MAHPNDGKGATDTRADLCLARRCVNEQAAREELFRLHAPQVYRLARRIVGSVAGAEDVVQDTFIQVFDSIHGYRGEAPLGAWLRRVAVRCACGHCKQQRRRAYLELVEESCTSPWDAARELESRATLQRVEALLSRLPATRRAVFLLHEVEGYALAEVAAMLGISVTAAKKRVWRARQDLQRMARRDPALRHLLDDGGGSVHDR